MRLTPNLGKTARTLYVIIGILMLAAAIAGVIQNIWAAALLGIWGVVIAIEGLAGW